MTDRFDAPFEEDCVTIIAPSIAEAMEEAQTRALAREGYTIAGRVRTQEIAVAGGEPDMFAGRPMIAATWVRRRPVATATAAE